MTRTVINAKNGPKVKAPLSHAVRTGNLLYVSGMPPYFGDREFVKDDFEAQFHQSMKNLIAVLEEAGSSLDKVVKVMMYLRRESDFWPMNELYRQYFKEGNYPARTTIVCGLGVPVLLEIECVAEI
ncbi:MAG: RidA family protein [Pseudolabrys sp.]|nr:RidA family protein [Pseudolabrys sp.]MCW5684947.1 RidA family protein [Pseudolabrys sp.]